MVIIIKIKTQVFNYFNGQKKRNKAPHLRARKFKPFPCKLYIASLGKKKLLFLFFKEVYRRLAKRKRVIIPNGTFIMSISMS